VVGVIGKSSIVKGVPFYAVINLCIDGGRRGRSCKCSGIMG
jgi:hypothetical protein